MHARLLIFLFLVGCGGTSEKPKPATCAEQEEIQSRFDQRLAARATGEWVTNDCDAFLWDAKLHSVQGAPAWKVELAEREPGRFERRPSPCWTPTEGDVGSETTWSRDMARGLNLYGFRTRRLDILERHFNYGVANKWLMGWPIADGRVIYSPALIGALAQTIFALGGPEKDQRRWPDFYPTGLVDYQAHLQVLSIQHRGEVEEALRTKSWDAVPVQGPPAVIDEPTDDKGFPLTLDISGDMLGRLKEHAAREPQNALFQSALARYTGDETSTEAALLADPWFRPSYVRCADQAACDDIEWLFAADIYLRACKG